MLLSRLLTIDHPAVDAVVALYDEHLWDGNTIHSLTITIATHGLWMTYGGALRVVKELTQDSSEPLYHYTLRIIDDDEPIELARSHLYHVGDIIELTNIQYRIVGGTCRLDCGIYSHFVLDCIVDYSEYWED